MLAGGERLGYDRLLLATGAEPRRLSVSGADLDGIYYLRTLPGSERLRERIGRGGKLVVVGAGWIGCEVAASARLAGLAVTVIGPGSVPLEHVLGVEVGAIYRDVHTDHGVEMLLGTRVEAFEGDGRVERVRTADGRVIDCDFVVAGIGAIPRTALAENTKIVVYDGCSPTSTSGGGPTGVEMAGQIAELARDTLRRDFHAIDSRHAQILLVEASGRILPPFPPRLSATTGRALQRLGVTLVLDACRHETHERGPRLITRAGPAADQEVVARYPTVRTRREGDASDAPIPEVQMTEDNDSDVGTPRSFDPERGAFAPPHHSPLRDRETNPRGVRHIDKTAQDHMAATDRPRFRAAQRRRRGSSPPRPKSWPGAPAHLCQG